MQQPNPNPNLTNPYAHNHHHHTQYYSHFPTQNPNPNPNSYPLHQHHQLQIESQFSNAAINPDPPGAESYYPPYSINHASSAYNAHHAGAVTYSQAIGAPATATATNYPGDVLVRNWTAEEAVQQYGNALYATGVPQDGSQHLLPTAAAAAPTQPIWNPTVHPRTTWKKTKLPKKTKIAQSAWCEICKVECNTKDVLYNHKLGKKHIKNLEKLNSAAAAAAAPAAGPIIGPAENPKNGNAAQKKKKAETPEDLEMKRRKVLEGGAASNAVRTCTLCNVVCNSDTVFRFHLAGQKHLSLLKKSQQAVAS